MLNSDSQDVVQVITDDINQCHSQIVTHMSIPQQAHVQHMHALTALSLREWTSGRCTCITCSQAFEYHVAVSSSCRPQGI